MATALALKIAEGFVAGQSKVQKSSNYEKYLVPTDIRYLHVLSPVRVDFAHLFAELEQSNREAKPTVFGASSLLSQLFCGRRLQMRLSLVHIADLPASHGAPGPSQCHRSLVQCKRGCGRRLARSKSAAPS